MDRRTHRRPVSAKRDGIYASAYFDGDLPVPDIALEFGVSESTVYKAITRERKRRAEWVRP